MSVNVCQISKMTYNHFNMLKDKKFLKKIYFTTQHLYKKQKIHSLSTKCTKHTLTQTLQNCPSLYPSEARNFTVTETSYQ